MVKQLVRSKGGRTAPDTSAQTPSTLIDNKRKHMEGQLSAAQQDEILINESKKDAQFKRDIAETI